MSSVSSFSVFIEPFAVIYLDMENIPVQSVEEDEEIDIMTVSDDNYVEGDLEYFNLLTASEDSNSDEDINIVRAEPELTADDTSESSAKSDKTVKIEELIIPEDDYDYDTDDHSTENVDNIMLNIVTVESLIPERSVELVPAAPDKQRKCCWCSVTCKKPRKRWMRCKDVSCVAYLCRRCKKRSRRILINTVCISCGWKYRRGPTGKLQKCLNCLYWKCPRCVEPCRCVVRSSLSHHNFV